MKNNNTYNQEEQLLNNYAYEMALPMIQKDKVRSKRENKKKYDRRNKSKWN